LASHGIDVRRDITIISCDNEQIRLSALHPRPASIETGAEEIGFRAVMCLCSRMQRPHDPPLTIQLAPKLALSAKMSLENSNVMAQTHGA
jgi:DNA-binding LacI/PurR family transcriptional regulator